MVCGVEAHQHLEGKYQSPQPYTEQLKLSERLIGFDPRLNLHVMIVHAL